MPRLNASTYQDRRASLRTDWDAGGALIRRLSTDQQWALHDYYLFTRPLDDTELETARAQALVTDPTLTTRAGLAYRAFTRLLATQRQQAPDAVKKLAAATRRAPRRRSRGPLKVTSVDVDEPDPYAMARLLVEIAGGRANKDDH